MTPNLKRKTFVTSFMDDLKKTLSILKESESEAKMDLDAFLSQFVLIKTPYGYILARAPQQVGPSCHLHFLH